MLARQLTSFSIIGLIATAAHAVTAISTLTWLSTSAQTANLAGFLSATIISYLGHSKLTFSQSENKYTLTKYIILLTLGYLFSSLIVYISHETLHLPYPTAMLYIVILIPIFNFTLMRYWVFTDAEPGQKIYFNKLLLSIIILSECLAYYMWQLDYHLSGDSSWYMYATEKWLSGEVLYRDIIEVNPPLAFYLTIPAVIIRNTFNISPHASLFLTVGLASSTTLFISWILIDKINKPSINKTLFHSVILLALFLIPIHQPGQREHLFIIFSLPLAISYLVQSRSIYISNTNRMFIALYSSLGVLLKPYFIIFPILIGILNYRKNTKILSFFDIEVITLGVTGFLYLLATFILHKEYFTFIIPLASATYSSYGHSPWLVISRISYLCILISGSILYFQIRSGYLWHDIAIAFSAIISCAAIYLIQFTGYPYQWFPFYSYVIFFSGYLFFISKSTKINKALSITLGIYCLTQIPILYPTHYRETDTFNAYLKNHKPSKSIMIFSTNLWPAFPSTTMNKTEWVSRFPAQWPLPGSINMDKNIICKESALCFDAKKIQAYVLNSNIEDIENGDPDLIFIDRRPKKSYISDVNFEYLEFMNQSEKFKDILSHYQKIEQFEYFEVWHKRNNISHTIQSNPIQSNPILRAHHQQTQP